MKRKISILVLAGLALAAGCSQQEGEVVSLSGSSTLAPVISEIAQHYEREQGIEINVQSGGSGRGLNDLHEGLTDIAMVSRALKPEELGDGRFQAVTVARDGIALIVHADNPVKALSSDQVRAVYRGEVDNWSALGGPDREITVINKASGRATLEVFLLHFGLDEQAIAADMIIGENQQGIKTVASNPDAIGYVSIGAAEYEEQAGTPIRLVALDGVAATTAAVANGDYPLSRQLNLVMAAQPRPAVSDFVEFARSARAAGFYHEHYFIPTAR